MKPSQKNPKCFSFRIRERYLKQIMNLPGMPEYNPAQPTKNIEYRRDSPFWQKRIFGMTAQQYIDQMGTVQYPIEEKDSHFPVTLTEKDL